MMAGEPGEIKHRSGMRFMKYKQEQQNEKGNKSNPLDVKRDGPEPDVPKFRSQDTSNIVSPIQLKQIRDVLCPPLQKTGSKFSSAR